MSLTKPITSPIISGMSNNLLHASSVDVDTYWAGFNGTSSKIDLTNNFDWSNAWSMVLWINHTSLSNTKVLIGSSTNGSYRIQLSGRDLSVLLNGSTFSTVADTLPDETDTKIQVTYAGGATGAIVGKVNDVTVLSETNDAASVSNNSPLRFGQTHTGSLIYSGKMRDVVITNDGAAHYTGLSANNSEDTSGSGNDGTDTAITYSVV